MYQLKTATEISKKNGPETQSLAFNKLLVFSERSMSHQHVVTRLLIPKQKMSKEIVVIKKIEAINFTLLYYRLTFIKQNFFLLKIMQKKVH